MNKKLGRPKIDNPRSRVLTIRLTPDELDTLIHTKAADQFDGSMPDYLRSMFAVWCNSSSRCGFAASEGRAQGTVATPLI